MVSGLLDEAGQRRAESWKGTCGTGWVVVRFDAGTRGAYSTDASNFPGAASASAPSLPRMNCTLGGMIGEQLLRSWGPADRQGGGQRRRAGGAAV
jgi:hypothetical protein